MININTKKTMPGHIIIKLLMSKDKRKSLKYPENKRHNSYRGTNIITAYYSLETMEARKQHHDIFKMLQEK